MSVPVTCPFCRSVFTLAEVPAARRAPCPNCGESAPVSADATDSTDATAPPPDAATTAPPPRTSNVVFLSLGLTAVIVAGFALWFLFGPKSPPTYLPLTSATTPPRAVSGLKYIPKDSQLVAVVQPSALDEYAVTRGRTAEKVFADLGLPADLFDTFAALGLRPEDIHSLVFAAHLDDLRPTLVLTLRKPPADAGRFRDKLAAKRRDPDRDTANVVLGGLPLVMREVNDRTFVFALTDAGLAAAGQPTAGYDDLPAGLKESIDRLNPSAFAWVATDRKEWAKAPQLKLLPAGVFPPEAAGKLDGVRAVAASLALEPNLWLVVSVRVDDSTVATQTAAAMRAKLTDALGSANTDGEWATATVPLESPAERLVDLKELLKK